MHRLLVVVFVYLGTIPRKSWSDAVGTPRAGAVFYLWIAVEAGNACTCRPASSQRWQQRLVSWRDFGLIAFAPTRGKPPLTHKRSDCTHRSRKGAASFRLFETVLG